MILADVPRDAFAMPFTNPSYPRRPYRFTDPNVLRVMEPEPLELGKPVVEYDFIRMPIPPGSAITPSSAR